MCEEGVAPLFTLRTLNFSIFAPMMKWLTAAGILLCSFGVYAQEPARPTDTLPAAGAEVTTPLRFISWKLTEEGSMQPVSYDTTFSLFHRHRVTDKYSPFQAHTGGYGLPMQTWDFFRRYDDPDAHFMKPYYPLMHRPENEMYFNTKTPFAEMRYSSAGSRVEADQTFDFVYTQNVNEEFNFGLDFDVLNNRGQYLYQATNHKLFSATVNRQGKRHQLFVNFGYNKIFHQENGGITLPEQLETEDTRDIATGLTALNEAQTQNKDTYLHVVNRLALGRSFDTPGRPATAAPPLAAADTTAADSLQRKPFGGMKGVLSHTLHWERMNRLYIDESPLSGFYTHVFADSSSTFDSTNYRTFRNTLRFDFETDPSRKFTLGGGIGLRHELDAYWYRMPTLDTLIADSLRPEEHNLLLLASLHNRIGEGFSWQAKGKLYLSGYRQGDFRIRGEIDQRFRHEKGMSEMQLHGKAELSEPSRWMQAYGSNHVYYEQELDKVFRLQGGMGWKYPARKMRASADLALLSKYAFYDSLARPVQTDQEILVWSAGLFKRFDLWYFGFENELLLQGSSHPDILDLPLLSLRHSTFFQYKIHFKLTGGDLYTQLGFDLKYHSPYYADGYMPATGRFVHQREEKPGNYPYVDVFLNLKVQRTRFFLAFEHVNSGFTGFNYYEIPSYPLPVRVLKYGIAWTFYD